MRRQVRLAVAIGAALFVLAALSGVITSWPVLIGGGLLVCLVVAMAVGAAAQLGGP